MHITIDCKSKWHILFQGKSRRELEGERIRAERIRREEESYKRPQFVARKYCFD